MKDLKNKNKEELQKLLDEKKEALQNFRFNISGSKQKNVKAGRDLRKEIAQILTEANSR